MISGRRAAAGPGPAVQPRLTSSQKPRGSRTSAGRPSTLFNATPGGTIEMQAVYPRSVVSPDTETVVTYRTYFTNVVTTSRFRFEAKKYK